MEYVKNFSSELERRKVLSKERLRNNFVSCCKSALGYAVFFLVFFFVTYISYVNFGISSPLVFIVFILGVALVVVSFMGIFGAIGDYQDLLDRTIKSPAWGGDILDERVRFENDMLIIHRKYSIGSGTSTWYSAVLSDYDLSISENQDGGVRQLVIFSNKPIVFTMGWLFRDPEDAIAYSKYSILPSVKITDAVILDEKGYADYSSLKKDIYNAVGEGKNLGEMRYPVFWDEKAVVGITRSSSDMDWFEFDEVEKEDSTKATKEDVKEEAKEEKSEVEKEEVKKEKQEEKEEVKEAETTKDIEEKSNLQVSSNTDEHYEVSSDASGEVSDDSKTYETGKSEEVSSGEVDNEDSTELLDESK